jgi:hypothetical protein
MLQPTNIDDDAPVAQTNDVPAVQEPATGGALAYDPEFSIDDVQPWSPFSIDDVQPWSPQFSGDDYGMPF